jgi:hypothetical protein
MLGSLRSGVLATVIAGLCTVMMALTSTTRLYATGP